jgi:hypothetical protein
MKAIKVIFVKFESFKVMCHPIFECSNASGVFIFP